MHTEWHRIFTSWFVRSSHGSTSGLSIGDFSRLECVDSPYLSMRNIDKWAPSKYVYKGDKLIASRDPHEVGIGSRLVCDRIAACYDRHIKTYARGRLVDLGCGTVPLFASYRNYVDSSTCADWGNPSHQSNYLDLQCDLSSPLPFRDRKFDTVILSDVLEHIFRPENLWNEMARILSSNGKVLMTVPFYYWLHEEPYDYYRYTEFALIRFAEMAGFRVVVLERLGGVPEIVADIFAKAFLYVPRLGTMLSASVQRMTTLFVRTPVGARISRATSGSFPLGYFVVAEKCG